MKYLKSKVNTTNHRSLSSCYIHFSHLLLCCFGEEKFKFSEISKTCGELGSQKLPSVFRVLGSVWLNMLPFLLCMNMTTFNSLRPLPCCSLSCSRRFKSRLGVCVVHSLGLAR